MELEIRDLQYEPYPEAIIRHSAHETCQIAAVDLDRLSVVLMDDEQIHEVNRRFRHRDCPTDVISFEAEREAGEVVGEIIISLETARRQAQAQGNSYEAELAWLTSHGVLHVAGMTDETEEQLERMLELQRIVMNRMELRVYQ